jgi:hypothetical protein
MATKDRRPLSEGLTPPAPPVDPEIARKFIHGDKLPAEAGEGPQPAAPKQSPSATQALSRVPISTRIRGDFAAALKRCSLERQLHGTEPNTLQDILEEAIEPWLKNNGYMP